MIKESLNFVCTQETLTVLSILPLLNRKKLSIQFKTLLSAIVSLSNIYYIHNQFGPSPKKKITFKRNFNPPNLFINYSAKRTIFSLYLENKYELTNSLDLTDSKERRYDLSSLWQPLDYFFPASFLRFFLNSTVSSTGEQIRTYSRGIHRKKIFVEAGIINVGWKAPCHLYSCLAMLYSRPRGSNRFNDNLAK